MEEENKQEDAEIMEDPNEEEEDEE